VRPRPRIRDSQVAGSGTALAEMIELSGAKSEIAGRLARSTRRRPVAIVGQTKQAGLDLACWNPCTARGEQREVPDHGARIGRDADIGCFPAADHGIGSSTRRHGRHGHDQCRAGGRLRGLAPGNDFGRAWRLG